MGYTTENNDCLLPNISVANISVERDRVSVVSNRVLDGLWTDTVLCIPRAGNHNCCEIMSAIAVYTPQETFFNPSLYFLFCTLLLLSYQYSLCLRRYDIKVLFRV